MKNQKSPYSATNPQKRIEKFPPILIGKHPDDDDFLASYGQTFVMLAAPPGTGKGVGMVIPNALTYPDSMVINDPKFENWHLTAGFRASCGQEVFRFSPEMLETHRWNPLSRLNRDPLFRLGDIKSMASVLFVPDNPKNASFFSASADIFTALVLYLMETPSLPLTLPQIYEISAQGMVLGEWAKKEMEARSQGDQPLSSECLREMNRMVSSSQSKTGWPITQDILNKRLSLYGEKTVAWAVSGDDIRFEDLRRKKMTVYFCVNEEALLKFGALMNLFYSQAIAANSAILPEHGGHHPDGTLIYQYQVLFLMDEFAVMGVIEKMKTALALTRGAGLRYLIIFQGKAQLRSDALYGFQGANGIMDAVHIEVVYAPGNIEAATEYSQRLGNTTVKVSNFSENYGEKRSRSRSSSDQARPLMLPQEVNELPYDKALIFVQATHKTPALKMLARKIFWYEEPVFQERVNLTLPSVPAGEINAIDSLIVPMNIHNPSVNVALAPPHDSEMDQEQQRR
ncbi:conjugal transfer protein [Candidatus Williamhamiltonella defendens]|uniref:Conjugal transfer protein n=1 Tax=Candidatus Williamhamiltonella defendens TaxID=138072 RepID=A0A2D3T7S5_9ENTR|nr:type IV secretory system conjugative DNA transfer family protein [Candidatus Hamiltonella defensa]ATW29865.1 conjugal transfer protein [Candidatus Hamiltonella defensa]ATW31837.1 conjugal transfer protein [Candidatus Hamiltonella defensa]